MITQIDQGKFELVSPRAAKGSEGSIGSLSEVQKTPLTDLKKYVENPSVDMNWLLTDTNSGSLTNVKRDNSFEEEVKSCRKQFLAETITEFILSELINEVKSENLYFKIQHPLGLDSKINLSLYDDP